MDGTTLATPTEPRGNAMLKRTVPVLTFAVALSVSNAGYALDDDETEVELSGAIASVDCPSSLITVETASGRINREDQR